MTRLRVASKISLDTPRASALYGEVEDVSTPRAAHRDGQDNGCSDPYCSNALIWIGFPLGEAHVGTFLARSLGTRWGERARCGVLTPSAARRQHPTPRFPPQERGRRGKGRGARSDSKSKSVGESEAGIATEACFGRSTNRGGHFAAPIRCWNSRRSFLWFFPSCRPYRCPGGCL